MNIIRHQLPPATKKPTKLVRSRADLAINGAQPAFAEALHVGRPNIASTERFLELIRGALDRRWLTNNGPLVEELERRIADYLGVKHCVVMSNGTIALEIAIRALELKGEVIVPSYTFIATVHALYWQGITPVFADIDPDTHNLDPAAVERMITPKTSGIIGVHLWGRPAPVRALEDIASSYGLKLMFDAAHALGSSYDGRLVGRFGAAEVFSFHATKFFNSAEGGAVTTESDELADRIRLMRNFGFAGLDNVVFPGTNGKMTELCAAMGLANFEDIENVVEINRANYIAYKKGMDRIEGLRIKLIDENQYNNFQYVVVEVDDNCPVSRDDIVSALKAENVLARKYFWPGCHKMQPYRDLFPHAGLALPSTDAVAGRVIVLPTGSAVNPAMCAEIADILSAICRVA
ncbi:MAG: DegT/DnrJ/EryC1/StrS family aminotransferase [Methylocystis sp.]|uniref:DegT/DnrJ/EryC1/StrS family aminotransferase n=1 Tax=Methylocystis sp. TaxID=1911079 RepID=UPI003DA27C88